VALVLVGGIQAIQILGDRHAEDSERVSMDMVAQQVRTQYGLRDLAGRLGVGAAMSPETTCEQIREQFARGPAALRQRMAVVAGDLEGPSSALATLDGIEKAYAENKREFPAADRPAQEALRSLYAGRAPAHSSEAVARLPEQSKAVLRERLGWFGDLALAPEGSADRTPLLEAARRAFLAQLGLGLVLLNCLAVGFIAALLHWIAVARCGPLAPRFRLAPGAAPHGVYAETFAVWLVLWILLSIGFELVAPLLPHGSSRLLPAGLVQVASLAALLWPVRRGVPWSTVRDDLGLRLSATPFRDAFSGIACWFMALPVMACALVVTVILAVLASSMAGKGDPLEMPDLPSHPVVGEVMGGSWLIVLFLAAVLAPLVEETVFRGVLYRHLRDATGRAGRVQSVILSAAISGFVFAAIHPQGWIAVPLLMSVAWPMVHAREWRGSLVAPMAVHAWHNALVTLGVATMLGG
jgi:membrane protease YdiL (CAAX protease family)